MNLEALKNVQFQTFSSMVEFSIENYQKSGRMALQLHVVDTHELYGTLTCNLPEVPLEDDEIIVKVWSENTQLAQDAFNTGLFENTGKLAAEVRAPIWRIK
jgi:hypothetical protein